MQASPKALLILKKEQSLRYQDKKYYICSLGYKANLCKQHKMRLDHFRNLIQWQESFWLLSFHFIF